MVLNFDAFRSGQASYADTVRDVTHTDLYQATNDFFDTVESIISDVTDMGTTFVPHDPDLKDPNEEAYTLGHVIVHLTATLEESSSIGSVLARGIAFRRSVTQRGSLANYSCRATDSCSSPRESPYV